MPVPPWGPAEAGTPNAELLYRASRQPQTPDARRQIEDEDEEEGKTSNIEHRTSNLKTSLPAGRRKGQARRLCHLGDRLKPGHQTSNIQHRTSNIQFEDKSSGGAPKGTGETPVPPWGPAEAGTPNAERRYRASGHSTLNFQLHPECLRGSTRNRLVIFPTSAAGTWSMQENK
jgi:hypothetical protein